MNAKLPSGLGPSQPTCHCQLEAPLVDSKQKLQGRVALFQVGGPCLVCADNKSPTILGLH